MKPKLENIICIYKITNPNGLIYIGQSLNYKARIRCYRFSDGSTTKINRSFEEYAYEDHKFEIIERCEISKLDERERFWQDFYKSLIHGLNTNIKIIKKPRIGRNPNIGNRVIQLDKKENIIREWISLSDACNELKINKPNAYECINGFRRSAGGFVWKYKTD